MRKAQHNIVFILTDQHRYDILGANGSDICRSPSLDRLAARGVRFTQAYSICGLCSPARASIYTGVLPHRHGIIRNTESMQKDIAIPPEIPSLAERLKEEGYRSCFIGKWHAGARVPADCGFEGTGEPGYGSVQDHPDYVDYLAENGLERPEVQPLGVGWGHNLCLAGKSSGPLEATVPYYLAERAIKHLEAAQARGEPFLLALNVWGPHAPYLPCEPYASMYDWKSISPWGNFRDDFKNKPPIYRRYRDAFIGEGNSPRTWEECARWAALYFGFATQIDAQIGRVLEALEPLGLGDNTAVLFSTDHGDLTGAHGGMHDKGGILCQEVYHVPLIGYLPGSPAQPCVSDVYCSNLDIPATILDIAGCAVPENLDSRSLLPILQGVTPADWPDYVVAEFFGAHYAYEARMVVHKGFKYIYHPGEFDELYDLESDPWEMTNLVHSEAHRLILRRCRERLLSWSRASGDDLCILCGLFEKRDPVSPETIASYGASSMNALRTRAPRSIL